MWFLPTLVKGCCSKYSTSINLAAWTDHCTPIKAAFFRLNLSRILTLLLPAVDQRINFSLARGRSRLDDANRVENPMETGLRDLIMPWGQLQSDNLWRLMSSNESISCWSHWDIVLTHPFGFVWPDSKMKKRLLAWCRFLVKSKAWQKSSRAQFPSSTPLK